MTTPLRLSTQARTVGAKGDGAAACDETADAKFPNLEQLVVESCQVLAFHRARTACTHRYEVGLGFIKLHQCRSSVDSHSAPVCCRASRRVGPPLLTKITLFRYLYLAIDTSYEPIRLSVGLALRHNSQSRPPPSNPPHASCPIDLPSASPPSDYCLVTTDVHRR